VFPAAGWQASLMKKEFTPEGMLFGHNTLTSPTRTRRRWPRNRRLVREGDKDYPEWEADRAIRHRVLQGRDREGDEGEGKLAVAGRYHRCDGRPVGRKPRGKGSCQDHIADQTFVQGSTTHNNKYDS